MSKITGTREWSVATDNCVLGCTHRCRYCYARATALQYRRITSPDAWGTTYNCPSRASLRKRRKPIDGRVMFPSTHDITPEHLDACLLVIRKHLDCGNRLLVVSKPHLDCIQAICAACADHRNAMLFRFTIGARRDDLLRYWEPGAPSFQERLASLKWAYRAGFATSVSCEPLLDSADVVGLVGDVERYVTDSVWVGKMNHVRARCVPDTSEEAIRRIEAGQTEDAVWRVYESLRGNPVIRWKDSCKRALGLVLATEAGEDT